MFSEDFYERHADAIGALDDYSRAKHPHLYAQSGAKPGPRRHAPAAERQVLKASRAFGHMPKPAPRPETREQKLERLHSRVRAAIPDVMAKAMADFSAGRITALDVSRVEAQLNRMREIVA
jgi:hypothetical protein